MNTARYIVAFLVIVTWPPALLYWLIVHPFIDFWRALGPRRTYTIVIPALLLVVAGMVLLTDRLLAVQFGTTYYLWPLVLIAYALSIRIELQCRKHLKFKILVGVPELSPPEAAGNLLTDGIYGKMRHPRYVSAVLGLFAIALFTNYLALYVLLPATAAVIPLIVHFEERELQGRFGEAYLAYAERVPRYLPRRR